MTGEPLPLPAVVDGALVRQRLREAFSGLRAGVAPSVWAVAAAFAATELAVAARYGFHRDELYFVVAGRHPALGYVDQPPLAPMLVRLSTDVFGTSAAAIRVVPALAGAGVVLVTAVIARLLGGDRRAQLLAAVAVACAPVTLAATHLANTTVYDLLAWNATIACVLAAVLHGRSRAWLGAGLAVGLGLENKDLLLLLAAALAVGVVTTGRGRVLADRWLWAGVAIAVGLWLPNLVWQATHGWPERTMSSSLHREHSAGGDYVGVLPAQLVYLGLAAVPLAFAGVRHLMRERPLRFLAVALGLVVAFVVAYVPGRAYYTDGLLGLVFAAGAAAVTRRAQPADRLRRWLLAPPIGLLVSVVIVLPVLPPAVLAHVKGIHKVNYDLGETVGWPELTRTVTNVYDGLPAAERSGASVFTNNYGEAGALVVYGGHALPPVLSGHNSFGMWGPGGAPDRTVIAVDTAGQLRPYFATCRQAAVFRSPYGMDNDENGAVISVCEDPVGPWSSFWPALVHDD